MRAKKKGRPRMETTLACWDGYERASGPSCQRLNLCTVRRARNCRRSSSPMPSPTRFSAKTSTSPVMSGAATTRATTPATTTRLRFHHGRASQGPCQRPRSPARGPSRWAAQWQPPGGSAPRRESSPRCGAANVEALAVRSLPERQPVRPAAVTDRCRRPEPATLEAHPVRKQVCDPPCARSRVLLRHVHTAFAVAVRPFSSHTVVTSFAGVESVTPCCRSAAIRSPTTRQTQGDAVVRKTQLGPGSHHGNRLRGSCCYVGDEEDAARPRVNSEERTQGELL